MFSVLQGSIQHVFPFVAKALHAFPKGASASVVEALDGFEAGLATPGRLFMAAFCEPHRGNLEGVPVLSL